MISLITDWVMINITGIVGITGIFIAVYKLSQANKQLKNTTLTNVLSLEAEINDRKEKVDGINHEIEKLYAGGGLTKDIIDVYEKYLSVAVENWLNSVDRLCFCIRKGYLIEKDWKIEYRNLITNVVKNFEEEFGAASKYTNIIDINEKLRRE